MSDAKLPKGQMEMLRRIVTRGPLLEMSLTGSGGPARLYLKTLILADLVELVDHPTVKDRPSGSPARAVAATELGRTALALKA